MTKQETYEYLRQHGIAYEVTEHKALYSMSVLEDICLPHPELLAKNLFVCDAKKRDVSLITVKGEKRVKLNAFSHRHNLRHLSFASEDMLTDILHVKPGSVSPLALLENDALGVTLYIDEDFIGGMIGVHPCDNTATMWLQTDDILDMIRSHGNSIVITHIDEA